MLFAKRRAHSAKRHQGFTLIELLVVIAIIALLAAILFPVFARARENARKSSCTNNVKQLMLGVAQYTQDFDEAYPIGHNIIPNPGGVAVSWNQILIPYIKTTQSFVCPSDSNLSYVWAQTPAPQGISPRFPTSYMANWQLQRDTGGGLKISDVAKASSTVYMSDGGLLALNVAPWVANLPSGTKKSGCWILQDPTTSGCAGCATNPGDPNWGAPNTRHLDTANVGFADGHVKAMKFTTWYYGNTPWLDPARGG